MSTANPTGLKLCAAGALAGREYRVAGRVVLSTLYEGEPWYWNEFHLIDRAGGTATLVHEDEGDDSPWKLFTDAMPSSPPPVAELEAKAAGDTIALENVPLKITLVGESRVEFIEGEAPEGVEVGDVARYFNAQRGTQMFVVSWTGDEVEVFRGMDLPPHAIRQAFGTSAGASAQRFTHLTGEATGDGGTSGPTKFIIGLFAFAIGAGLLFAQISSWRKSSRPRQSSVVKQPTPAAPLATGQSGRLLGTDWKIASHAVIEVTHVGARYDRHDYRLAADDGSIAWLVSGLNGKPGEWHYFTSVTPPEHLTPTVAAAYRSGQRITIDDITAIVDRPFQTKVMSDTGDPAAAGANRVRFNLSAHGADRPFVVTWNSETITVWRGTELREPQVTAAFRPAAGAAK